MTANSFRQHIIDSVLRSIQPGDGDVVAIVNELLTEEKQPQLDCAERRDVLKAWQLSSRSAK